jgi:hypothetical protein
MNRWGQTNPQPQHPNDQGLRLRPHGHSDWSHSKATIHSNAKTSTKTWPSKVTLLLIISCSIIHKFSYKTTVYIVTITEIYALFLYVKNYNKTPPNQPWYRWIILPLWNILISHTLVLGDANLKKCEAYICVNMILQKFQTAWTLRPWVQIWLKAWMFVLVYL